VASRLSHLTRTWKPTILHSVADHPPLSFVDHPPRLPTIHHWVVDHRPLGSHLCIVLVALLIVVVAPLIVVGTLDRGWGSLLILKRRQLQAPYIDTSATGSGTLSTNSQYESGLSLQLPAG
jgi:hypothetical protein